MRFHRFYVEQPLGEEVVIENVSLVSQWINVFRYKENDVVILFNGDGYNYFYSISKADRKQCLLIRTKQEPSYIPGQKITLCLSLIKKDNFELVVQKATELGVTTIIPILSARSEKKNLSFERLEKIAIEAAEQCHRGDVPVITPITALEEVLAQSDSYTKILLTMEGKSLLDRKNELNSNNIMLFIGPEGGFSPEEYTAFTNHQVESCSLGKTVLRAETAAILGVGIIGA